MGPSSAGATGHGSSPRMWGTGFRIRSHYTPARFIPTHVGNGNQRPSGLQGFAVHPHACGERCASTCHRARVYGSSPRMWGTGHLNRTASHHARFIPTHVGNGLHGQTYHAARCGSSPRMWGTGMLTLTASNLTTVHPHACGERGMRLVFSVINIGSSPRMWGTAATRIGRTMIPRFIPTHVGNGMWRSVGVSITSVHPHACGERHLLGQHGCRHDGSSPRMWGTDASVFAPVTLGRFIPTHVGNG